MLTRKRVEPHNMGMFESLRPHCILPQLTALDCTELAQLGIRGVLLDVDNTLTRWRSLEIAPEVEAWIQQLQQAGMRACVLSNSASTHRVQTVADRLGLPWITRAVKPLPHNYRRAMQMLETTPETTAIIGDQLLTDILGGNRLGMYTILVEPIDLREAWTTSLLQRPFERMVGRIAKDPATLPPHFNRRLR